MVGRFNSIMGPDPIEAQPELCAEIVSDEARSTIKVKTSGTYVAQNVAIVDAVAFNKGRSKLISDLQAIDAQPDFCAMIVSNETRSRISGQGYWHRHVDARGQGRRRGQ